MYHYTYIVQSNTTAMRYIGVRSSKCVPVEDVTYWGSSKHLPVDVRVNHTKLILKTHATRLLAVEHEVLLHTLNDVAVNPLYYNKAKQTSTGFDTAGTPMSNEAKNKISKSTTGKPKTPLHTANSKAGVIAVKEAGYVRSAEHKNKLSIANKLHAAKPGYVNPRLGTTLTAATRSKLSASIKASRLTKSLAEASPRFKPWFIITNGITELFYTKTKGEYAKELGFPPSTFRDACTRCKGIKPMSRGRLRGVIVGNLPTI